MLWVHPNCSLTIGVVVVTGDELMRPLSGLGDRLPLTLISQPHPPVLKLIQHPPVNLYMEQKVGGEFYIYTEIEQCI